MALPAPQKACSPQPLAELSARVAAPECLNCVPEGKKLPWAHPAQLRHQRIAVDAPLAIEPLKPYRLRHIRPEKGGRVRLDKDTVQGIHKQRGLCLAEANLLELPLDERQIPLQKLPRPQGDLSLAFQVLDICF